MKIGVVHFGSFSVGINRIIHTLIEKSSSYGYSLQGITFNRHLNEVQLRPLSVEAIISSKKTGETLLTSFPEKVWIENSFETTILKELDLVVIFGGPLVTETAFLGKTLHIPSSIYNDIEGSHYSLGYDTALNSIIENIEKIRDTACSLSYMKLRVFNVKIPGLGANSLLLNTAIAVDAHVVTSLEPQSLEAMTSYLQAKAAIEEGYCFLLMNDSVDPYVLQSYVASLQGIDLDCKVMEIDESVCVGPYPTALDVIITKKITDKLISLLQATISSGRLVIKENEVHFQAII